MVTATGMTKEFKAPGHRLEFIRSIEGTQYYNDSKATNPEASIVAINSFPNKKVVLIAGGRDKKTSLDDFVEAVKKNIEVSDDINNNWIVESGINTNDTIVISGIQNISSEGQKLKVVTSQSKE